MASAMHHTMQTCQNLCAMTQSQMLDEDKIDPFPAKTTVELEEMLYACGRTKEVLARESLIYSADADFSKYTDSELVAMNAFVRENSRMLSIILAGGTQHFWNGHGLSTATELKNLYPFIDRKVKEFFLIDKIMETLEIRMRYGRKGMVPRTANPATHPELLAFSAIDANRAATSQESLLRLATVCEQFAAQCRSIAQVRVMKMDDRTRKLAVHEQLLTEVDSCLPALRQHVLKIGLSKTQLQNKETNKGQNAKMEAEAHTNATKLTALFTYKAVEDAHRSVEDCRERLMQELLFRRSKVERRLRREEEMEMEEERLKAERFAKTGQLPGSPTRSYEMLMEEDVKNRRRLEEQQRQELQRENSHDSTKGKAHKDQKGGSARQSSRASSRDPTDAGSDRDSKSKSRASGKRNDSRSPSPKSRSKAAPGSSRSKLSPTGSPRSKAAASPKKKEQTSRTSPKARSKRA